VATQDLYGLVGQVLDGQFRVDRVIGEGGFSVVYRGQHVGLDEPVAIKCLKLQTQLGSAVVEAFIRRFRDESKIHYRLSRGSLHIARTIAAGTTMAPAIGALVPYMVLEWLEGYTLAEELRARRQRGEKGRAIQEVLRLLDPVAEAMAFAHAQGVVHRDLNPSNVFVAYANGSPKLKVLDFGVAKVISDHALSLGPRAATVGQIRMFTPAYAAPEQFHDALGPIGPQTDVYSFAVLTVELLADRAPIDGEHIGEYADRALDPERRPTPRAMGISVGDAVEAVIAKAVTVDPSQRPSDIGEFWGMLKNAATRDAQLSRAVGEPGFPQPPIAAAPSARPGFGGPMPRDTAGGLPSVDPGTPRQEPGPPPFETKPAEQDAGRYRYYSNRPGAPSPDRDAPTHVDVEVPNISPAMFAKTAKSGDSDPPPRRDAVPGDVGPDAAHKRASGNHLDETLKQGLSADTSRMGTPARKVTLLQGSPGAAGAPAPRVHAPGAPTPTPGPYTASLVEPTPPPGASPYAASIVEPAQYFAQPGVSRPTAFAATLQTPEVQAVPVEVVPAQPAQGRSRTPLPPGMHLRAAGEWQAPVIRQKPEKAIDPVDTPKKSNVPMLVLIAVAVTVALVIVAIITNELGR
jgi:serine/threonine-protein kinase